MDMECRGGKAERVQLHLLQRTIRLAKAELPELRNAAKKKKKKKTGEPKDTNYSNIWLED